MNDPQDTDTLTDEEIETRRFDTAKTAPTADTADDTLGGVGVPTHNGKRLRRR